MSLLSTLLCVWIILFIEIGKWYVQVIATLYGTYLWNTKEYGYIFVIKLLIECYVNSHLLSECFLNDRYLKELYRKKILLHLSLKSYLIYFLLPYHWHGMKVHTNNFLNLETKFYVYSSDFGIWYADSSY